MSELLTVNGYNQHTWQQRFLESDWPNKIEQAFGSGVELLFDGCEEYSRRQFQHTPRGSFLLKRFSAVPFYYLEFLLEKNPELIVDIGCGENLFKKLIPNIQGYDPQFSEADVQSRFDQEFSAAHTDKFESAFSIAAIHNSSLITLFTTIMDFANIIKPGGRGFISLNIGKMLHDTPKPVLEGMFGDGIYVRPWHTNPVLQDIAEYCDRVVRNLPLNLLVVDNLITKCHDEYMDGNLRLVFEK